KIEILETAGYGRMLVLDGQIMCTEKDECVYHEMIAHVPALLHPNPQKLLVIGGGDGGAVRELIRHTSIQHIDLVEIDKSVVETAIAHLPTLSHQLNDPRVHVHFQDGVQFMRSVSESIYDIILIDIPGMDALQSVAFYHDIHRALTPTGIMVSQIPPPVFFDSDFPKTIAAQQNAFETIHPYFAFIPTYATGMLSFSFASKNQIHPVFDVDTKRAQKFTSHHDLQYYTKEIHKASFAVPPFVQTLISSGASQ
ncbi:MAG: polyamine aminopropyltransferase, partial [Candidatus Latescibacteria bacterium]|nr:polyamine aminopropyltransferase [Candidatus Latescibacterota bacterium]